MVANIKLGRNVAEARARFTPPLSRRKLARRLKDAGIKITLAELALIEAGERTLNCYEMSILASVLKTTVFDLIA
jgi:hypothetical protein